MPDRAFPCRRLACALILSGLLRNRAAWAQPRSEAFASRYFAASDGTRLHYLQAGPPKARTIVLIPGWTMPAWIFAAQIDAFARDHRVIAFDPRGQGKSDIPRGGYTYQRRSQDIADLLAQLGPTPVVVVAWSLAVLEVLAYIATYGDARLDGLILVDNSVGEEPPPVAPAPPRGPKPPHAVAMRHFVRGMFRRPHPEAWLDRLTEACLRVPEPASRALLAYPVPRSYWRKAIYAITKPILYVVRPKFAAQAGNLARHHPNAESVVLNNDVGHALFVDDPVRFNALMRDFIARKIRW